MSARPAVSIVVPTWNGRALLEECLPSIAALDYPADRVETVVFDNGSADGTRAWLAEHWPAVRVLASPTNLGFAAASNRGAAAGTGSLIAFLNNDLRVRPDWLARMVDALEGQDAVAAGSLILDWEGRRTDFGGAAMNFHGHGSQRDFGRPARAEEPAAPEPALFACGGAMLVRREALLASGGFDEDYFAYFEDVDLGWRLWLEGGRVLFVPDAVAFHRHHGSALPEPRRIRLLERNGLATIVKNYDDANLARVLPVATALAEARAAAADPERAAAIRAGAADFDAASPAWHAKRRFVQERRRRPDAAILPLFREPFRPSALGRAYWETQQTLVRTHGIAGMFGGAVAEETLAGLAGFVGDLLARIGDLEDEVTSLRRP